MKSQNFTFPQTHAEAVQKALAFIPRAGSHYADFRNFDESPNSRSHVSELSPSLQSRLLTEAELLRMVFEHHTPEAAQKFCQEVLWRAYWRSWLELRPQVWSNYCQLVNESASERHHHALYRDITEGRSQIACMNQWVRELTSHGYLHNHARMWFASLWIFTFRLPWHWGAQFFLEHLADGDAASNTLSWRWIAGLHTKGKTYLASADNIARFSGLSVESQNLATSAEALREELDLSLRVMPSFQVESFPSSETKDTILLLAGDDLSPHRIPGFLQSPWLAIACLDESVLAEKLSWSDPLIRYRKTLADKAREEWQVTAQQPIRKLRSAEDLHELMRTSHATQLVVLEPSVGPHADAISDLLSGQTSVSFFRRGYDVKLQALGKKGFFDFWKQAQDLLAVDLLSSDTELYRLD